jgi:hypothetical protein
MRMHSMTRITDLNCQLLQSCTGVSLHAVFWIQASNPRCADTSGTTTPLTYDQRGVSWGSERGSIASPILDRLLFCPRCEKEKAKAPKNDVVMVEKSTSLKMRMLFEPALVWMLAGKLKGPGERCCTVEAFVSRQAHSWSWHSKIDWSDEKVARGI